MQWLKRILIAAVIILVVATPINDIGKYLSGYYNLDTVTRRAADEAASVAKRNLGDTTASGLAAMGVAQTAGIVVYGYDQSNGRCTVWTRANVPGTWVWGPVLAAMSGKPYTQWWGAPVPITGKADSVIF